jgi:hypothetical protein
MVANIQFSHKVYVLVIKDKEKHCNLVETTILVLGTATVKQSIINALFPAG